MTLSTCYNAYISLSIVIYVWTMMMTMTTELITLPLTHVQGKKKALDKYMRTTVRYTTTCGTSVGLAR